MGALLDAVEDFMRIENHHAWSKALAKGLSPTMRPSRVWEAIADVWCIDVLSNDKRELFTKDLLDALTAAAAR
jgi:hypothetical protein